MKKLLSEIITAWWSEVDTKLVNPKSEEAIKGLKLVLREDFGFDSDVIDYVVEMVRSTPTNFDLGGKTSGIDVGKNQTAVSAQLHPVWDDDEEEDDEDDVYNNNDGELSEWDVTLLDGLDELNEDTWVKHKQSGNVYQVKNPNPEIHTEPSPDEISNAEKSGETKPKDGDEASGEEETQQQQPDNGKPEFSDSDKVDMMTQLEKDKKKEKDDSKSTSPKITDKVYGTAGEGDTDVKNDMFKYGFSGYQKGTGKRPAPGSAGSAFNEIASGEGVHMLNENPNMSEEDLARKMYEQYSDTALGKEQSASSGVGSIPKDIENKNLYSKCVIAARSAKTKFNTTQNRVKSLQDSGKFGKIDKIDTYYGAAESIQAQVDAINDSNRVLLPNGTEVGKEDAVEFVKAGGGGMNPSDTATFVKDGDGNLLIQFHSDKTSTADIQDNSTLAQEGENYKSTIDKIDGLSAIEKENAKKIVDKYSLKISNIEENYNNQTSKIATRLSELPIKDQISIIENDKGTLKKNIEVAIFGKDGKPKSQFKDYLPQDATTDSLSMEEKYDAVRKLVVDGNGKSNEIKVITKVGLALQSKDPSIKGIDVKELISSEREQVVNLQRERVKELNSQTVDVEGVDVPLGRLMEAEETIRGFHLTLMDYPPKDYKDGEPSSMVGASLDVNMGGTQVNGDVLRSCMGVASSTEFKQKFRLNEVDEIVKDKEGNVTGKTVFVYAVDSEGKQTEIGKKTYRSKAGATGKTNNTFTYSSDMQKCFKSK